MNATVTQPRSIERLVPGQHVSDGAGVRITRLLSQPLQQRLDPFLMLDLFGSDNPDDYIAGFPPHPHRGFETVTYMLEGRMRHRDSAGHEGLLGNGGVQWMTAGRGIVHSEMPEQEAGRMEGFQLWLNLPAADKLCAPWYRDFAAGDLPHVSESGAEVTVIAGTCRDVAGAVTRDVTQALFLDVALAAGGRFSLPLAGSMNAFVVAYRGDVSVAGATAPLRTLALLANDGDGVQLASGAGGRAILVAGRPLHEPIAQYGPFVMNTTQQIHEAMADYRAGRMG